MPKLACSQSSMWATLIECAIGETDKALTGPFLTLRSPLGMTPAMLDRELPAPAVSRPAGRAVASPRQPPALTRRSYQQFSRTRKELLKTTSSQRLQSRAVDFRRVWWDKGLRNASKEGMSIWRPNPPAGYTPLGERNPIVCPSPTVVTLRPLVRW